jgi:hypothetical protein
VSYSIWSAFGESILAHPQLTLAAFLGVPSAVGRAGALGLAVPARDDFRVDPAFDPNPHRLKLQEEYLATMLDIRVLAAWGADPLVRASVVCSQMQLEAAVPMCVFRPHPIARFGQTRSPVSARPDHPFRTTRSLISAGPDHF